MSEGKVDAAFVASHRFMETVNAGKVKLEDFNILWSSPLIPQDPFVYRNTLCDDLKKKIADTFLLVDQNEDGKKYLANVKSEKVRQDGRRRLQHRPRSRPSKAPPMSAVAASRSRGRSAAVLEVRDLRVSYASGKEILKGMSFDVGPEDFFAIIGPERRGQVHADPLRQPAGGAELAAR